MAIVVFAAACGGGTTTDTLALGAGADTPEAAVRQLVGYLNTPDFDAASSLVFPGQAALASLAEGATFAQVAAALNSGDRSVAANFWSGFGQGAGVLLTGQLTAAVGQTLNEGGVEFQTVVVTLDDGGTRQMVTRSHDGYRIDLFASFGAGIADKMILPVERLLSAQTDDAATILPALREIVPSLLVASRQPDLSPQGVQDLLQLVELITRIN